ncbi:hypothetical protein JK359_15940 [Streptomyces actinomycinicus]|uniref:Uncharacterized protein n=1 Tax=Streptomyces actinomycinicus TaxID=1695166 RepID=A0A937EHZ1_9ACTN|nr:hypothetical protein [Streptomyces actinomycinicus]MBL1083448.1 hypothetical protein [Streptomyces actinomycinicus]
MSESPRQINKAGGIFAALIVVFIFGFFVGLPVIVWVLLAAAFVGLWVATAGQRAQERATEEPQSDRPWRHNRDEK